MRGIKMSEIHARFRKILEKVLYQTVITCNKLDQRVFFFLF